MVQNEGHEQMSQIAGQLVNFGLIGNTVSDIIRLVELEEDFNQYRPRVIAFLTLLSISLFCQVLFLVFTVWRFLHLRNKRDEDPDSDCCGDAVCQSCHCCRGTGDVLFAICFILTVVIMVLQVSSGIVGTIKLFEARD